MTILRKEGLKNRDSNGSVHISPDDMATIYRSFHAALSETYWDMASNHEVCIDAMNLLKSTHLSGRSGRFLFLFTSLLSEAYSHAHYNVKELQYNDRIEVRAKYWSEILLLYKAVMTNADEIYAHSKCDQRLALLLHFASLFSLYKDVADVDFIVSLYRRAEDYINDNNHQWTYAELEQFEEYYDAIQTIYHLRNERQLHAGMSMPISKPDEAPTLVLDHADVADQLSMMLSRADKLPSEKHQCPADNQTKLWAQKPSTTDGLAVDADLLNDDDLNTPKSSPSLEETSSNVQEFGPEGNPTPLTTRSCAQDCEGVPRLETSSQTDAAPTARCLLEREIQTSFSDASNERLKRELEAVDTFDFREEFNRRFRKKKAPRTKHVDLPVIGRPAKADVVYNYRRKALFDNVNYCQPPTSHSVFVADGGLDCVRPTKKHEGIISEQGNEDGEEAGNNSLSRNALSSEQTVQTVHGENHKEIMRKKIRDFLRLLGFSAFTAGVFAPCSVVLIVYALLFFC